MTQATRRHPDDLRLHPDDLRLIQAHRRIIAENGLMTPEHRAAIDRHVLSAFKKTASLRAALAQGGGDGDR